MKKLNSEEKRNALEHIIRKCYQTDILEKKYLGGGSYGDAFWIKINVHPFELVVKGYVLFGMHETEQLQLSTLSKNTSVKMPIVYHLFDHDDIVGFDAILMEYIDGVDAFTHPKFLLFPKKQKEAYANAVTDGLIELHQTKGTTFGFLDNPTYLTWNSFYLTIVHQVMEGGKKLYEEKKLGKKYFVLLEKCNTLFDSIFDEPILESTLTHGDLNVMNTLVDRDTFELKAFIDPFNSMWADRDYDLFQLNNMTGKKYKLFDTYFKKATLGKKTKLKCAYYAFMNEILCYILSGWTMEFFLLSVYNQLRKELKNSGLYL